MKSFFRKKLPFILIALEAVLIAGILLYMVPGRYRLYNIVLYDASENFPDNPLIGYAPEADHLEDCENTSLVFITLPFSEWEPEEGCLTPPVWKKSIISGDTKAAVSMRSCVLSVIFLHRRPTWISRTGSAMRPEALLMRMPPEWGMRPITVMRLFLKAHREALEALASWCRRTASSPMWRSARSATTVTGARWIRSGQVLRKSSCSTGINTGKLFQRMRTSFFLAVQRMPHRTAQEAGRM